MVEAYKRPVSTFLVGRAFCLATTQILPFARIAESTTLRRSLSFPERGLSSYFGLPQESIRQAHRKLQVETTKIGNINQEIGSLFRGETVGIQTLRIKGNLKSFDLDVLAR